MKDFLVKYKTVLGNRIYPGIEEIKLHNPECQTLEPVESDEELTTIIEFGLAVKRLALYNIYKCYGHCNNFYLVVRYVRPTKEDNGMSKNLTNPKN